MKFRCSVSSNKTAGFARVGCRGWSLTNRYRSTVWGLKTSRTQLRLRLGVDWIRAEAGLLPGVSTDDIDVERAELDRYVVQP